jgi:hypothetical protein
MSWKISAGVRWLGRAVTFLALLWIPAAAFGQNCALCYTQAAGAGSRVIQALRSGILVLVIPPVLICIGLTVMAYKKRNQFNEE